MSTGSGVSAQLELALAGNRRALGRLLSMAERGGARAEELDAALYAQRAPKPTSSHVIGLTGAPGSGKSTLTGRLLDVMSHSGLRVAVLAVDPSSPHTGGAILGDRIRMGHSDHPHSFVRSLASRGSHGGLAAAVPAMIRVFEAAGYDTVIVETVGVGQVELDVAALADTTVVVVTPGWGDAIQANKAGILEIADVFVVNKADRPGADDAVRDLEYMLDLSPLDGRQRPQVICTVAIDGTGIDQLMVTLDHHLSHSRSMHTDFSNRRMAAEVRVHVDRALTLIADQAIASHPDILAAIARGEITATIAATQILDQLAEAIRTAPRS